jgi:hypothetical protein
MSAKCEKFGCEKEAVETLRITDPFYTDVDSGEPFDLCEEHLKEVQQFPETDVVGVQKWLKNYQRRTPVQIDPFESSTRSRYISRLPATLLIRRHDRSPSVLQQLPHANLLAAFLVCSSIVSSGQMPSSQPALASTTFQDPGFRSQVPAAADAVIGGRSTEMMPYGVILHNPSSHSVVAYEIQWTFDDGGGEPIVTRQANIQLFAFSDPGNPSFPKQSSGIVPSGSSRLVTPAFNVLLPVAAHPDVYQPYISPQLIAIIADQFRGHAQAQPFKGVSVIAYMLDDGSCFAHGDADLCETVEGQFDRVQDLTEFVLASDLSGDRTAIQSALQTYASDSPRSHQHAQSAAYNTAYEMAQRTWNDTVSRQLNSKAPGGNLREYWSGLKYASRPVFTKYPM